MSDAPHFLAQILSKDDRYKVEAYFFVSDALSYAQEILKFGYDAKSEDLEDGESGCESQNHVRGQELCEGIRQFALKQFGYLAINVLRDWGITKTIDFGNIVFNLIEVGQMRKTADDCLEDFCDVYDFQTAFVEEFTFS